MKNKNIVILAGGISSRMKKPANTGKALTDNLVNEANSKSKSMISVGNGGRPFLDYLLYNISEAGYKNVLIVIGEKDNSMKDYYQNRDIFKSLNISFATQFIPKGREKPLGTADALLQGLNTIKEWSGQSFTVLNSDNLYSTKVLKILLESEHPNAMIDYDAEGFQYSENRVNAFAVTLKNSEGFLIDILEKPDEEQIRNAYDAEGVLRVSMNIFKLNFDMIYKYLCNCPVNPVRKEKELPTAIKMMISDHPGSLFCYPVSEHVPDLTNKEDIIPTREYLLKHYKGIEIN